MNDREVCIYSIVSLTGFMRSQEGEPDMELFDHMIETTRIARFPTISKEEMFDIIQEVGEQDQQMIKLTQDVCAYMEKKL